MHIVSLAWAFVVVLMAAAEATSPQGSLLGAVITLMLYGVLPLGIVLYLMGTPMRRRARLRAEPSARDDGDGGSHTASAPVAAERKET